jgi:glycosyltransferase involved in cell wall biosynthesis
VSSGSIELDRRPRALILVENTSVPTDPRVWPECQSLARAGWDVTVVGPRGRQRDRERQVTIDGIRVHRFDLEPSGGSAGGYVREYGTALTRIAMRARALEREHRFDVVQACTPPDLLLLAVLPWRRRCAFVLDHHDLSPELYEARYARRGGVHRMLLAAERVGFALADVVISTNESFRRVAIERGRKRAEDVFVVRNGPNPDVFRPRPADPELRGGAEHVIGYVGLMGRQDGVEEALRALSLLPTSVENWRALFLGDGEALEGARRLARHLGIGERTRFTGFIDDRQRIVEAIASCDICLSPEPRNPLNEKSTLIKVAEYMAVARPVVAFDLPETRATAGDSAAYAARDDAEAYAAAITDLLLDPGRRQRMGEAGRRRIIDGLSWTESERTLLAAYHRALDVAELRRGVSATSRRRRRA